MMFWKRDALDTFGEAIRPELHAMRTPPASAELRDRILRDREAGARVILPVERRAERTLGRYLIAAAIVSAALLAIPLYRGARDARPIPPFPTAFSYFGEVSTAEASPPRPPQLPPAFPVLAERLHAGTFEYSITWRDSTGHVTKQIDNHLSLIADTTRGIAAWRLTSSEHDPSRGVDLSADTVFVARRDLALLSQAVHRRPFRRWNGIEIQQRIVGDSVIGRMTLDDVRGMRPIARRLPREYAPYVSDVFAPLYLAALPIRANWEGTATLLGWAVVPNDVVHPVEMRVIGEERIEVPAGRFDCWKLSVRYMGETLHQWIRKSDGVAVRLVEQSDARARRVVTLVRETR